MKIARVGTDAKADRGTEHQLAKASKIAGCKNTFTEEGKSGMYKSIMKHVLCYLWSGGQARNTVAIQR